MPDLTNIITAVSTLLITLAAVFGRPWLAALGEFLAKLKPAPQPQPEPLPGPGPTPNPAPVSGLLDGRQVSGNPLAVILPLLLPLLQPLLAKLIEMLLDRLKVKLGREPSESELAAVLQGGKFSVVLDDPDPATPVSPAEKKVQWGA